MAFSVYTRYGAQLHYGDDADVPTVVEGLLSELEEEQFDEPDDEHTEISVSHGNWAVGVKVSGLMILNDLSWITGSDDDVPVPALYIRATSRSAVADLLCRLARGEIESVRVAPWMPFARLEPFTVHFFRRS